MTRKLVIFNDHSWTRAQYRSRKRPVAGNATLAHLCLNREDDTGVRQISLLQNERQDCPAYARPFRRFFGTGISKEILTAYHFLVHNYMPGDEIYLIGAGRGAYSLQWLAEMISISGLLKVESVDNIKKAYTYSKLTEEARHGPSGQDLRESFKSKHVRIRFLGCWDSVGAKGTPVNGLQGISKLWTEDHSGEMSDNVDVACQALALDENNPSFDPHIWTGVRSSSLKNVEQVWFSGKHANITGGQRDSRLSDIAFRWLLNKAAEEGLSFDLEKIEDLSTPDALGCIVDEPRLSAFTNLFRSRSYQRPVGIADTHLSRQQIPGTEKVHSSVKKRESKDPSYSPAALASLPPGSLPICDKEDVPRHAPRRYERLQVNCPATLLVNSSRFNGNMLDYSSGGARIWMPLDLPVGTPVTLRSSVLFDMEKVGHVVWHHDQSLGLEFTGEITSSNPNRPPHRTLQ